MFFHNRLEKAVFESISYVVGSEENRLHKIRVSEAIVMFLSTILLEVVSFKAFFRVKRHSELKLHSCVTNKNLCVRCGCEVLFNDLYLKMSFKWSFPRWRQESETTVHDGKLANFVLFALRFIF